MKINIPVSNMEYALAEHDSVVSKTELRGIITDINEDFLRMSGFTGQELIGASHNTVRRPDMPPEAFEAMWQVAQSGPPVDRAGQEPQQKRRFSLGLSQCRSFYENDRLAGYVPVHSKSGPEQNRAASAAYRLFREGKAGHLEIQEGKVVKATVQPAYIRR